MGNDPHHCEPFKSYLILTFPPPGVCLVLANDPTFDETSLVFGEGVMVLMVSVSFLLWAGKEETF